MRSCMTVNRVQGQSIPQMKRPVLTQASRPKITVQGEGSSGAVVSQPQNSGLATGETRLAALLRRPEEFINALRAQRPDFIKPLLVGSGLALAAILFIPGLLKLGLLGAIGIYVGLKYRKHVTFDPIAVCLDQIRAKERVKLSLDSHLANLREQVAGLEARIDVINQQHQADFKELARLLREEGLSDGDEEVQSLAKRVQGPFRQRQDLRTNVERMRREIVDYEGHLTIVAEVVEGLATVKATLEAERALSQSRQNVLKAEVDATNVRPIDPNAMVDEARAQAAGQMRAIDQLHQEGLPKPEMTMPEGAEVKGEYDDLFKQIKNDEGQS